MHHFLVPLSVLGESCGRILETTYGWAYERSQVKIDFQRVREGLCEFLSCECFCKHSQVPFCEGLGPLASFHSQVQHLQKLTCEWLSWKRNSPQPPSRFVGHKLAVIPNRVEDLPDIRDVFSIRDQFVAGVNRASAKGVSKRSERSRFLLRIGRAQL